MVGIVITFLLKVHLLNDLFKMKKQRCWSHIILKNKIIKKCINIIFIRCFVLLNFISKIQMCLNIDCVTFLSKEKLKATSKPRIVTVLTVALDSSSSHGPALVSRTWRFWKCLSTFSQLENTMLALMIISSSSRRLDAWVIKPNTCIANLKCFEALERKFLKSLSEIF